MYDMYQLQLSPVRYLRYLGIRKALAWRAKKAPTTNHQPPQAEILRDPLKQSATSKAGRLFRLKLPLLFSALIITPFRTPMLQGALYNGQRRARPPHDHYPPSNPLQHNWRYQWTFGHIGKCRVVGRLPGPSADMDTPGQIP